MSNIEVIQRFMTRVRAAKQGRSKDVRMTTEDAQELSNAIGELLATRVSQLEAKPPVDETVVTVSVDGGSFRPKE